MDESMRFFKEIQTDLDVFDLTLTDTWTQYLDPRVVRPLLSCLALMFFFQGTGYNTIIGYSVILFRESGQTMHEHLATGITGGVILLSAMLAVGLAKVSPRKTLLVVSSLGTSSCLCILVNRHRCPNHFKMVKVDKATWKANYFTKITRLFDEYSRCFIVGADNVGSKQMQEIRMALRGDAEVLMGKNTMMRKAIRGHLENNPSLEKLLPHIVQNIGFVFTNEDLVDIRDKLLENKKRAPARAGAIAPLPVIIPAQNTGLGPEKTSFFQALQIPTKISRGTIEIVNDVQLLKEGDKVGASEATLLNMLNISPFTYGLVVQQVYDQGTVYSPKVLDIKEEDILASFRQGLSNLTAACLYVGFPTMASVPQSIVKGFSKLLAVAACTEYSFKEAEYMKSILADPSKFAAVAAAAAPAAAEAAPAAAKEEEPEEESDDDMGFGLFD